MDTMMLRVLRGLLADAMATIDARIAAEVPVSPGPVDPPVEPGPVDPPAPPVDPDPVDPAPVDPPAPPVEPPTPDPVPVPPVVGGAVAKSVADIVAMIKPGGTVVVRKDAYGPLVLSSQAATMCEIVAEDPSDPAVFTSIQFKGARNLGISGFRVCPDKGAAKKTSQSYLVYGDQATSGIVLENLTIEGRDDAADCMDWAKADWLAWCWSGIQFAGPGNIARLCALSGVNFGLSTIAPDNVFSSNILRGVSGDGIRLNGDRCVARDNIASDFVLVDANHPDAIQAFGKRDSATGSYADLTGLVIEGNQFIEWTERADNPLRAKMQGIGGYNGRWIGASVRRNRILTTSFTGISVGNLVNGAVEDNYFGNVDKIKADCARFNVKGSGSSIVRNQAPKYLSPVDATNIVAPF